MDALNQSYILSGPQDDAIEEQNERLIDQLSQKVSRMKSVMKTNFLFSSFAVNISICFKK